MQRKAAGKPTHPHQPRPPMAHRTHPRREGVGVRHCCHEHLDADEKVLEPRGDVVGVIGGVICGADQAQLGADLDEDCAWWGVGGG